MKKTIDLLPCARRRGGASLSTHIRKKVTYSYNYIMYLYL